MLTLWTSEKCFNWCLMQLFFFSPNGVNKAESEGSLNVSCGSMQGRQAVKTDPASNLRSTDLWELFILQIFSSNQMTQLPKGLYFELESL